MSVAKINPFHMKMLTFTLRCYITHESLKEVGRGPAQGPGWSQQREPWASLDSCEFRDSIQHRTDLKFCVVQRASPLHRFSPLSSKSSRGSKKKKRSWDPILNSGEHFFLIVFSLPLPWWQIFITGFNQQAPVDSDVKRELHF